MSKLNIDFTNDAKQFEEIHDFLDQSAMNGGNSGSGRQRRVNLIKMAMEHGAKVAIAQTSALLRQEKINIAANRVAVNGHQDSQIFSKL